MQETGLSHASAVLAQRRQYSDSIVSPLGDPKAVAAMASAFNRHGLSAIMGGRFLGISGPDASKGHAVARLLARYPVVAGAVGGGPNDASMLEKVDYPYIVLSKGLDFRCYAAAASQARRMTRISSGVGWSG